MIYIPRDIPRVLEFYKRAVGLETRFHDPTCEIGELETGGPSIAFASFRTGEMLLPGVFADRKPDADTTTEIGFFTKDVPAAYVRAVEAGAESVTSPKLAPWGQTVAYVRSIEGTLVGICTPMGG